ncbi:TetR-family transcriptional regulator [Streptomyces sp. L-9-10]|uniref:TetR/AcrR family transcriptional regulator n=1 Tax=unclassified Streptomyces TaxID=2593676 RepID=UPI0010E4F42B|nr:TetR/AcrR family transcriptional regulator [Streptomyces sp. L-9-10]RYJ29003.1 TetR-family transcriptional regulator [Streptomyces sp. L-9-10]
MDTAPFLAYLDGRHVRWQLTLDQCVDDAGDDPRARLLAVFDALRSWAASSPGFRSCALVNAMVELADPQHPARSVTAAHKRALRARMLELAEATGAPDPGLLVDQLLLVYEGAIAGHAVGSVEKAEDKAHLTARRLIAAATPHPMDSFWAGPDPTSR